MNIFFISPDPYQCAVGLGDRHVVKMTLETAQMLSTAARRRGSCDPRLYKSAYPNHPMTLWVGKTRGNYWWTFELFGHLLNEYAHRYNKIHKCERLLTPIVQSLDRIPAGDMTVPPRCMPEIYHVEEDTPMDTVIESYREYYGYAKRSVHTWTRRDPPRWIRNYYPDC